MPVRPFPEVVTFPPAIRVIRKSAISAPIQAGGGERLCPVFEVDGLGGLVLEPSVGVAIDKTDEVGPVRSFFKRGFDG